MNVKTRWALLAAFCTSALAAAAPVPPKSDAAKAVESPEQRADKERVRRFLDDTLHSSDLRMRVMAGRSHDFGNRSGTYIGLTSTPVDALAEMARRSADPMVLALLSEACGTTWLEPRPTCDPVELASRWTVVEPENPLAWLTLSSAFRKRGDLALSRAAFEHASTASAWHEYLDDGLRVMAAAIPQELSPRARLWTLELVDAVAVMGQTPNEATDAIDAYCKDPTLRDACARIVDTIDRNGTSLFSSQLAMMVAEQLAIDAPTLTSRKLTLDALQGAWLATFPRGESLIDNASVPDAIRLAERRIELGELPMLRAMLAESGLAEVAWAQRYRQFETALRERGQGLSPAVQPK